MNTPLTGTGKYPLITFRMKDGKMERAEVEGNTEEQNKEFFDRITVSDKAKEVAAKMTQIAQGGRDTYSRCESRDGRLVTVKPMPVYCYGSATDPFPDQMRKEIWDELYKVFSGKGGLDDVKESFRDAVSKMSEHLYNQGMGSGSPEDMKQVIEDTYTTFRKELLTAANNACSDKGRELYKPEGLGTWKYYDASFYYMTEDVKSALLEVTREMGNARDLGELNLKPKGVILSDFYDDFNSIFRGTACTAGIVDTEIPPPRDFTFFMDMGRSDFGEVRVGGQTKRFSAYPGGNYQLVGDKAEVSGKDFDNADEINRFMRNLCFFDTIGRMSITRDNLWKRSRSYSLNQNA